MVFTLQCPQCHHTMKYQPLHRGTLDGKVKRCVYCGRSFMVRQHIQNGGY